MKPSRAALKARALGLAPEAFGVLESIIGNKPIVCNHCDEIVLCSNCGEKPEIPKADKLAMDAAVNVLKMAGVGPVERHATERGAPTTAMEIVEELLSLIETLEFDEKRQVIHTCLDGFDREQTAMVLKEIQTPLALIAGVE